MHSAKKKSNCMKLSKNHKRFITGMVIATFFWIIFFYFPPFAFSLTLTAILLTILIKEWTNLFKSNKFLFWLFMPFYPILPFALLIYMNHHTEYRMLLYYLFLIVFSFDSSAYMTGMIIGYHKIAPRISPGKTVEGCIGGFIGALIIFFFALWEQDITLSNTWGTLFVLAISTIAFLGDIFESILKRRASIKDSGDSLPGHGGFLDRFDAVMMVAYVFFIFRNQLVEIFVKSTTN